MGTGIFLQVPWKQKGACREHLFFFLCWNAGLVQTLSLPGWQEGRAMLKDTVAVFPDSSMTVPSWPQPFG